MKLYHGSANLFQKFNDVHIKDLGFHFGSKEQALHRIKGISPAYLYECEVSLKNSYGNQMTDLGQWDSMDMIGEYFDPAHENYEIFSPEEYKSIKTPEDFKNGLIKKGYDGISYLNAFENERGAESFIVFKSKQISILHIRKVEYGEIKLKDFKKKGRSL
jgi:hypothetical protein